MERVRRISGQLLAEATAAGEVAVGSNVPAGAPATAQGMTEEEKTQITKAMMEYFQGGNELVSDGIFPSMTMWDLLMATKHNWGITSTADARQMLAEASAQGTIEALGLLPGPWRDCGSEREQVVLVKEVQRALVAGTDVFQYADFQLRYGDRGLSSNIVVPMVATVGFGPTVARRFIPRVILADPSDAERISRTHVRKEGNFENIIYDSVISTRDNEHWQAQRKHLAEAFLPMSSLAEILPVSLERAKRCAARLAEAAAGGAAVDMSDFLLHEAQAQLQLALLGAPESLMEATNADIRAAFMGDLRTGKVGALSEAMKSLMEVISADTSLSLPSDGCPVRGPLSRALQTSTDGPSVNYGNMLLVLFAGHDTTGHTMTWLLLEVARHPDVQRRLHAEVDAFFAAMGGRDPTYLDLGSGRLDFMDRCITETLRLWPAVAAGTYRQLQFDEEVRSNGGAMVTLPRGTPVQIVNWSRHRNPELWGPDADEFNPDRDFGAEELAHVGCPMAARNPQSERFSPFAHAPRNCLGRNFAQMEMRLIMLNLLRSFEFTLAPPYDGLMDAKCGPTPKAGEFHGVNRATMGPMDLESSSQHVWGTRHLYALKMNLRPRS